MVSFYIRISEKSTQERECFAVKMHKLKRRLLGKWMKMQTLCKIHCKNNAKEIQLLHKQDKTR